MDTFYTLTKRLCRSTWIMLIVLAFLPICVNAQQATIEGVITSAATGEPLPGANVILHGTTIGTATDMEGRYRLNVPGTRVTGEAAEVVASFVGFRSSRQTLTLTAGTHTLNFSLSTDILGLEDIVVTGVVGATHKERLPFSVDIVSRSALEEVPYVSADQALRGKVSGVSIVKGSGQPGAVSSIRLRGASTITGNQEPLYIVDGVILSGSLVDIDALDLESVEVVKGAAAASLYGARAANGIIHFRTRRGAELAAGQTTVSLRSEWGMSELPRKISRNKSHYYRVDDPNNPTTYLDADGNPIPKETYDPETGYVHNRVIDRMPWASGVYFADKAFVGETYDPIDLFFNPGVFSMNSLSITGRTEATNFLISLQNTVEPGVIRWDETWSGTNPGTGEQVTMSLKDGLDGLTRRNFRANLDHRITHDLTLSLSTSYVNSERDNYPGGLFGLHLVPIDVDLLQPNDDGVPYRIQPAADVTEQSNPLYDVAFRDFTTKRQRFLGNAELRYNPLDWLAFDASFSYDRGDINQESWYNKGHKTLLPSALNDGSYNRYNAFNFAINTSFDINVTHDFGLLATNTRVRYLAELQDFEETSTTGRFFTVPDLKSFSNVDPSRTLIGSGLSRVRSEGYFFITGLDYDARYILDFLVRRDGSSLFGPEDRWHTYYRVSGAYRIAQEPWWSVDAINELKLRYSLGTAGGRPVFNAQYETWSFVAGAVDKRTLGNRELKPEFSTEQEIGLEMALWDRIMFEAVYSKTVTDDALMLVPLSGIMGYTHRWMNGGALESISQEISVRAFAYQTRETSLSFQFHFDRSDITITEMNVPPYQWGPQLQNADVFINREGEKFGTFYGDLWITSLDQLGPRGIPSNLRNQFDINDDGYVVWVGEGNTYQDGISGQLWGSSTTINGTTYNWGMPIKYIDEDGNQKHVLGRAIPDFSLSFGTNLRYKGFRAYLLFDGEFGHTVYNMQRQWPMRDAPTFGEQDQRGKPDGLKKPQLYYQTLYNVAAPNSHFAEDASYVKLRELALSYTFDRAQLRPIFGGWVSRLTIGVVGRNLFTWSDFEGYDPEIGVHAGNTGFGTYGYAPQQAGATIVRYASTAAYPNYRTYSMKLEIVF